MGSFLHWADYVILVLFLCTSLSIGLFHACSGGRQRTTSEFIMADRKLKVLPTMMSLLVSFQSAIMILGHPAEVYQYGIQAWLGHSMGFTITILLTAQLFIPWIFPLRLISINEYFELRFGSKLVRALASFLGILSAVMYMAVCMYAPSLALEVATGVPVTVSIPVMASVCSVYTTLGGMKAVIYTDVFQFLVIMAGILTILIKGTIEVGGLGQAFEVAREAGRMNVVDFNPDPTVRHTFWTFLLGHPFLWLSYYALSQAAMQRYAGIPVMTKSKLALLLNIPSLLGILAMVFLAGVVMVAWFSLTECDPLASQQVNNANQIMALFVVKLFSGAPGFSGLFLATLYSGALSSVSSSLSGCAAQTWMDIIKIKFSHLPDAKATIINKALVLLYGAISAGVAFCIAYVPGPITQISLALGGNIAGAMLGLFILGGCFTHTDWRGCVVGSIVGFGVNVWISLGAQNTAGLNPPLPPVSIDGCQPPFNSTLSDNEPILNLTFSDHNSISGIQHLYSLSYLYYALFGSIITVSVGLLVSLIPGGEKKKHIEPELLIRWKSIWEWNVTAATPSQNEIHETMEKVELNSNSELDSKVTAI